MTDTKITGCTRKKEANYSHILKYMGLFGSVQGLNILIGIIRNKLVAILLGPEGMGFMSLLNSIIKLMSDSTNLGISMSGVKKISEAYEQNDKTTVNQTVRIVRFWSLLTAIAGMALCILLSPLLSRLSSDSTDYTFYIILISPVVAMLAVTGGETAILKGTRELRSLASVSLYGVAATLVLSVPLFYIYGYRGIIPSLLLVAFAQMFITLNHSYRLFPLHLTNPRQTLSKGYDMIILGVAFVIAGIMGSGTEFLIRAYLNKVGGIDVVGLYNAGYMMTITYAGMVFSAMETDYFPRLSATGNDISQRNLTVNRQIEMSLLLLSPMLVAFMVGLPVLLPLLYSGKFMPAIGMMQVTTLALYLRAVKLPIAYLPLASGDSKSYLLLESIYDVVLLLLSIVGYTYWGGLTGMGIAILLTAFLDFILLTAYTRWKYGYSISSPVIRYTLYQIPIGVIAYIVSIQTQGVIYWGGGIALALLSAGISVYTLHQKTKLWTKLKKKITGKADRA